MKDQKLRITILTIAFTAASWLFQTPASTAQSVPTVPTEVWIAVRTDGQSGTGTIIDPYDGSTQAKFDALMVSFQSKTNITIHLGPGTFQTTNFVYPFAWVVKSGWRLIGAGMYQTTVQMVGSLAGIEYGVSAFMSESNVSTDNVVISDLTVDCNWSVLGPTADTGAGGEKNVKTGAVSIWGSNNLVERVRSINSYGSLANGQEQFAIRLAAPSSNDVSDDVIRFCRAELPAGNYGSPFALHGQPDGSRIIKQSSVIGCTAIGVNNGLNSGFSSGGVNAAAIQDSVVDGNTFIDCRGVFYCDTGTVQGLCITNNTVVRGFTIGVGLVSVGTKQSVEIIGNKLQMQNRGDLGSPTYATYGIVAMGGVASDLYIAGNYISFDPSGSGGPQFYTIACSNLSNSAVVTNVADEASAAPIPVSGGATGSNLTLCGNRTTAGAPMTGLPDNCIPSPSPCGNPCN